LEKYRDQVTPLTRTTHSLCARLTRTTHPLCACKTVRHGAVLTLFTAACLWITAPLPAQNRGVYPLGMSAINSGLMPESTFTYSNQFLLYTRDEAKDNEGRTLPVTGNHTVILPKRTTAGIKCFKEFLDRSTFQGYSLQIVASIGF
jgi:hypothetical protein